MKWLYEVHNATSIQNGNITARRTLGRWGVYSNGNENTGPSLTAVWKNVYKLTLSESQPREIKSILVLGLGAGGSIKELYQHFSRSTVTAIEYDPVMISLAKEFQLWGPFPPPCIIYGDAGEIIPNLKDSYDLVIVDLFYLGKPSPLLLNEQFVEGIGNKLRPGGVVAVNVFRNPEYLEVLKKYFQVVRIELIGNNHIGIFKHLKVSTRK